MALTDRDRKMLIALGVIAALAAVYLFLVVLPGGGGSEGGTPQAQPTESVTPTASPTSTETPRPTSPPIDLVGDRDPFSIPPGLSPSPTGGGVSPTGTVSPPTSPPPTSPTSPPPTSPPPTSPPPTSPPPTSPPPTSPPPTSPPPTPEEQGDHILIGGHDVRLLDVFANGKRVQVEVDGRVYTIEEGATFDDNFKLVKILDHHCARFLFGDQSFELCAQAKK